MTAPPVLSSMKYRFLIGMLMTGFIMISCSSGDPASLPSEYADLKNVAVFSADAEPKYNIELISEVTYGHVDDPVLIAYSNHFVVDDSGRVIIADWNQALLQAYNCVHFPGQRGHLYREDPNKSKERRATPWYF